MKNKKCHTCRTIPKSNIKIIEEWKKTIPLAHIQMTAHFLCSIKNGRVKLVLLT